MTASARKLGVLTLKKGALTAALEKADPTAAAAALRHDVVFIRPSWPPLRTRSEGRPLSSKPSGRRSPISGRPGASRNVGTRTGDTWSRSTESLTATSFKSPYSLLRTLRTRRRAFVDSRARGRSSSSSGSTRSATYALIRSPTLSGRFRQLHRQSEGAMLGCSRRPVQQEFQTERHEELQGMDCQGGEMADGARTRRSRFRRRWRLSFRPLEIDLIIISFRPRTVSCLYQRHPTVSRDLRPLTEDAWPLSMKGQVMQSSSSTGIPPHRTCGGMSCLIAKGSDG